MCMDFAHKALRAHLAMWGFRKRTAVVAGHEECCRGAWEAILRSAAD